MKIVLYSHAGAVNHGCEAIIRGTSELLGNNNVCLFSNNPESDKKYGLNNICETIKKEGGTFRPGSLKHKFLWLIRLIYKDAYNKYLTKNIYKEKAALFLSVGGDVYCYENAYKKLGYVNKILNQKKNSTVLWGCSIEETLVKDADIQNDLKRYAHIFTRESFTYNCLKENGIDKCTLLPDPAFYMEPQIVECDGLSKKMVGINVSPLVLNKSQRVMNNYFNLIKYILNETDFDILFIPHVLVQHDSDFDAMKKMTEQFDTDRIVFPKDDYNAQQLKYLISKCSCIVTARTHVSIASYSQCIPTLVVGYSIKSKGIAKDIYGDYRHHVINVDDMQDDNELVDEFIWMMENPCVEEMNKYMEYVKSVKQEYMSILSEILEVSRNK